MLTIHLSVVKYELMHTFQHNLQAHGPTKNSRNSRRQNEMPTLWLCVLHLETKTPRSTCWWDSEQVIIYIIRGLTPALFSLFEVPTLLIFSLTKPLVMDLSRPWIRTNCLPVAFLRSWISISRRSWKLSLCLLPQDGRQTEADNGSLHSPLQSLKVEGDVNWSLSATSHNLSLVIKHLTEASFNAMFGRLNPECMRRSDVLGRRRRSGGCYRYWRIEKLVWKKEWSENRGFQAEFLKS